LPGLRVNEAILLARGKYIAYMFEDDEWYPNALEALVNTALSRSDECVVYGEVDFLIYKKDGSIETNILGNWNFNYGLLKHHNRFANCAVLHHKESLKVCGMYDPHILMRRRCDYDLWLRMARRVPFIKCNETIGKVNAATIYSLGTSVDDDPVVTYQLIETYRDNKLMPERILDYDVDSVDFIPDVYNRHLIREQFIIPFWIQHPRVLKQGEVKKSLASMSKDNRLIVTKSAYSTAIDVTIKNFCRSYPDSMLTYGFIQETYLSIFLKKWNYDTLVLFKTISELSLNALEQAHEMGKPVIYIMDDNMFKYGTGYMAEDFPYLQPDKPSYDLLSKQVNKSDIIISYSS